MYFNLDLSQSEIASLDKSVILSKFHRYIRLWFIKKVLPVTWLEDLEIIPYFTPCHGHENTIKSEKTVPSDEIDGVLQMQAYCLHCKREKC